MEFFGGLTVCDELHGNELEKNQNTLVEDGRFEDDEYGYDFFPS